MNSGSGLIAIIGDLRYGCLGVIFSDFGLT